MSYWEEDHTNEQRVRAVVEEEQKWSKPSAGLIKLNCDAAFNAENNTIRIAIIVRDHNGNILDGIQIRMRAHNIHMAEAEVIRCALRLAGRNDGRGL